MFQFIAKQHVPTEVCKEAKQDWDILNILCICCVNIVYMRLTQVAQLNSQRSPVLRPAERWLGSRSHRGFKKSLLRCASLRDFHHRPASSSALHSGDSGKQRLDTIGTWMGLVQFNIPLMSFYSTAIPGRTLKPLRGLTTSYDDFSSPTWDNIESEVLHGFRLSILLYHFPAFRVPW
jgi:hypothetical protein